MATEKRLIDAKEGKKIFVALARPSEYKGVIHMVVPISEIDRLPTVDAVEVVRCKECIYYHKKLGIGFGQCSKTSLLPYAEDFCSYGTKK